MIALDGAEALAIAVILYLDAVSAGTLIGADTAWAEVAAVA